MTRRIDRWFVPTDAHCCVIDVEAYGNSDWKSVTIGLLSTHQSGWRLMWRTRISNAWNMLRGQPDPVVDLDSREVVSELITALKLARHSAFGPKPKPAAPEQIDLV